MTTWFSATAVVPQLRAEWDLGNTAAAWLTIAVQVGFVAGALAGSALSVADVFPPRFVILAGALGAAAANLVLVAADGPEVGIAARVATGFFLAGVYPPALKLASTWFRRGRGTALGIVVGALTLGSAVPHLVNGLGGARLAAGRVGHLGADRRRRRRSSSSACPRGRTRFRPPGSTRDRPGSCCATAESAWRRSATSGTCGSCTRCGRGSSSSSRPSQRTARRRPTRPSR